MINILFENNIINGKKLSNEKQIILLFWKDWKIKEMLI
jgi:hypothetical protein